MEDIGPKETGTRNEAESSEGSYSSENEEEQHQKIDGLKLRIQENNKDWDAYLELINIYRLLGEVDDLRSLRLQFKQQFPLPKEIWIQWIDDEKQLVSDEEEKESICHLYQAALKDYYSIDLWCQYLGYVSNSLPSEMQTLTEEAISACEYDCIDGPRVWNIILEWSKSICQQSETEGFYRRMLSNPYQSSSDCLEDYKKWHEASGTEADASAVELGEKSVKSYEDRRVLQMELTASIEVDHISTALRHFNEYVDFEIQYDKKQGTSRAHFLYQRYAFTFREMPDFWHSYFLYVCDYVKTTRVCNQVSTRALRHIVNSGPLYEDRVLSLELSNKPISFLNELIQEVHRQGLASYYEYLRFYLACLASYRRRVASRESGASEALREFCGVCVDWLRELNKEWYDGIFELQKAVSQVYVAVLHDEALSYRIWDGILKFHLNDFNYWNEYIQFDRLYNQSRHARELYKRAAAAVTLNNEYILSYWEEYERNFGTLETWREFSRKSRRFRELALQRQEHEEKREKAIEETEVPSKRVHVETSTQKKRSIREKKKDTEVQKRTVFVNNLSFSASEEDLKERFQKYGEIVDVNVVRNNHGKSRGFAYIEYASEESAHAALVENGKELSKRKMEVKLSVPQDERKGEKSDKVPQPQVANTIYVSGLPVGVSEYEFSVYFSKCGKVKASRIIRDKVTRVGKGTGLLQFEEEAGMEEALKLDGEEWQGKKLHIQKSRFAVHNCLYLLQTLYSRRGHVYRKQSKLQDSQ